MFEGNKKVVIAVLLVIMSFTFWWFWQPEEQMQQEELFAWIQTGYSQQFCTVIFPKVSHCVSLKDSDCKNFAAEQMLPCLTKLGADLPDYDTSEQRKAIYDSVAGCFQENTHDELVNKYLINNEEECQRLMS